uniref:(northern house mosquito) hypothetical protein n=1 Tax=Culex pipiens TaxID=7175 RepID=A0A8D8CD67_CULPI
MVTAGNDQSVSSRRRSFDRINSDVELAISVSFSKEDEVFEVKSRPKGFISSQALPGSGTLGSGTPRRRWRSYPSRETSTALPKINSQLRDLIRNNRWLPLSPPNL